MTCSFVARLNLSAAAGNSYHQNRVPQKRFLPVFVAVAPPDACLVAPLGAAVEPLVHAPEAVKSARIGGIGVVNDAVLEHERAHARPLARVGGRVGSAHGRERGGPFGRRARGYLGNRPRRRAPIVVIEASLTLLLLGDRD